MRSSYPARHLRRFLALAAVAGFVLVPTAGSAPGDYAGPIFGIDTERDGSLLIADAARGVVGLGGEPLIAAVPGINDVAPTGRPFRVRPRGVPSLQSGDESDLWAVTSTPVETDPGNKLLHHIHNGVATPIADLFAFEAANNPHPGSGIGSNPFDVEDLGDGRAVVVDAAANDVLWANDRGDVRLVAVLPDQLVSTANVKRLLGCPNPAPPCGLPPMIPTESVPTSVRIGPDGNFYVGELNGFPAAIGESRVWMIQRNARGVDCATSPKCSVALDGLTSIIDLVFGPDGRLYVAQLDDASWFAWENVPALAVGGSVRACDVITKACETVVSGVPGLTSIAFDADGSLWGTRNGPIPGLADVVELVP